MDGGQGTQAPAVARFGEPPTRGPLEQDVYDSVRMACMGGLSGAEIIAAVQDAISDSREDAPAAARPSWLPAPVAA